MKALPPKQASEFLLRDRPGGPSLVLGLVPVLMLDGRANAEGRLVLKQPDGAELTFIRQ